jgi:peptide chain release factor 2
LKQQADLKRDIDAIKSLEKEYGDLEALAELLEEEADKESEEELESHLKGLEQKIQSLEFQQKLGNPDDRSNAIVSINAGAGGTEAQDWTEMILRMLLRWCEQKGYETEIIDFLAGDEAGVKSVTFTVRGPYAYGYLKAENGIHRLVRISPFDANRRRHTSFASVSVIPEKPEDVEIEIDEGDLKIDTYRASGAGGQHVNKTDSAVRITHLPTGIVVQCQNERSQYRNKQVALSVLKSRLYELKRQEEEEKLEAMRGEKKGIEWGSQIRSYVLHPYQMVKDHRTGMETGNVDEVLDGGLDPFINAYLMQGIPQTG